MPAPQLPATGRRRRGPIASRWRGRHLGGAALPGMVDVTAAVAVTVAVIAGTAATVTVTAETAQPQLRVLGLGGYLLVTTAGLVLAFRNVAPTATFAVTLTLGIVYQAAAYPGGPDPVPVVVALATIAAHGYRLRALGLGLLASALLVGTRAVSIDHGFDTPLLVAFPTAVVAALFVGQIVATRRAQRADAVHRAAAADRAREEETRRRVDAERLRIARELHDVVAHTISLINVQATMGVHLINDRPSEAAAALVAIKTASREALQELRRILDVLRQADEDEPTAPAPGVADLPTLTATLNQAGLATHLEIVGTPRQLPATVDVAAFRIVQEGLTNALRYAGGADARVTIHYQPDCLTVAVVDDGTGIHVGTAVPRGSGHGIAGMRERAAAVGGTLTAGATVTGGFAVHADLPFTPARA